MTQHYYSVRYDVSVCLESTLRRIHPFNSGLRRGRLLRARTTRATIQHHRVSVGRYSSRRFQYFLCHDGAQRVLHLAPEPETISRLSIKIGIRRLERPRTTMGLFCPQNAPILRPYEAMNTAEKDFCARASRSCDPASTQFSQLILA